VRKLLPFSAQADGTISARIEYKHTQNMQTSQGYIFRTLQYLVILISSLWEFTFFA
jgi:hypothetical protein